MNLPEAVVRFVVTESSGGDERVLATQSCEEYLLDEVEEAICGVANAVGLMSHARPAAGESRIEARVWSREGNRASLHLCAETVQRMASTSASFDFDLQPLAPVKEPEEIFEEDEFDVEIAPKPELIVLFIGNSPETGLELVVASANRALYSAEGLEVCIGEVIAAARDRIRTNIEAWRPEIGVRLLSYRGIRPTLYLPPDVVQAVASCGASLDFDPYV
jgi:hypothetical protein